MKLKLIFLLSIFGFLSLADAYSQINVNGKAEASVSFGSGENNPFWFTANKFGVSSLENNNGYLRGTVFANGNFNSKFSYDAGLDIVGAYNFRSNFIIQQAFFSVNYKCWRLTAGSKEYEPDIVDRYLSSGSLTYAGNARPIPQLRLSIPEYFPLGFTNGWLSVKGHVAYGFFTDNSFQKDFANGKSYVKNALYHSKAGFMRIGKESFPVNFEIGLTMFARFGGTKYYEDGTSFKNPQTIKDFARIFLMYAGGSKSLESDQANVLGDHLGNWSFAINANCGEWKIRPYYEHQFEDHSMLTFDYMWKDGLWGLDVTVPKNRLISKFVYEYMNSRDQSGPIYHDSTEAIPDQISSRDNYFNHYFYQAWQHSGFVIGSPVFFSPLYNKNNILRLTSNRLKSHHFGFEGMPTDELSYRVLMTYLRHWGTYDNPFNEISKTYSMLVELSYSPVSLKNYTFKLSGALDDSDWIGNNKGVMISVNRKF